MRALAGRAIWCPSIRYGERCQARTKAQLVFVFPQYHTLPIADRTNSMATSHAAQEKANAALESLASTAPDPWASSTTQIFVLIGVLYLSLRIFSFWRMIASLFLLPGTSVCLQPPPPVCARNAPTY